MLNISSDFFKFFTNHKKYIILFPIIILFFDLICIAILIPVQPFIAISFGASPIYVTMLAASFSLIKFITVPMWGLLSDNIGRKPVILINAFFNVLGFFIFYQANSLYILFISKFISGLGGSNIILVQAIIADNTSYKNRASGVGYVGLAFGGAFIIGPALGGYLSQFYLSLPALAALSLSILNILFIYLFIPKINIQKKSIHSKNLIITIVKGLKDVTFLKNIPKLIFLSFSIAIAFSMFEQCLGLYVQTNFLEKTNLSKEISLKKATKLTSYFLIILGSCSAIFQSIFIGRLVSIFGEKRLINIGLYFIGFSFLFIPILGGFKIYPLFLFLAFTLAIGSAITFPSITSHLSKSSSPNEQGFIFGLAQSFASFGRFIGPFLAGFLFQSSFILPFFFAAFLLIWAKIYAKTLK